MADNSFTVREFFQHLTGFTPYQFQQETILKLLDRQDVLLRAPTGAGKTENAIAPFLLAKANHYNFPAKLIYVVPLRTLANSLRQRAETLIDRWATLYPLMRPPVVTLQTGENPEDPRFEGDIVFCTIDQMLSSFLNIPYSVGRGSANINSEPCLPLTWYLMSCISSIQSAPLPLFSRFWSRYEALRQF